MVLVRVRCKMLREIDVASQRSTFSLTITLHKRDLQKQNFTQILKNLLLSGGIVLPLLGAVPDSAIIIVSGLGPDAQTKLSVGMG